MPPVKLFLEHIEAMSGLHFCIKAFWATDKERSIIGRMPYPHNHHHSPFCLSVKVDRTPECRICDLKQLPAKAILHSSPFVHNCHANASEVIIPIIQHTRLIALGFMGQFRTSQKDQPPELPFIDQTELERILSLATLIQGYFLNELSRQPKDEGPEMSRNVRIRSFLLTNLKADPRLEDLAREFKISPSRAGHMVKEETGESFVHLKLALRIEEAKKMLTETIVTIEYIASQLGFNDTRYFYRIFQQETGLTPGRWRETHQRRDRLSTP